MVSLLPMSAMAVAVTVAAAVAATPRSVAATAAATTAPGDVATITDWWVVNTTSGARLQPLHQYKPVLNATAASLHTIVIEPKTKAALPAAETIAAASTRAIRSPPHTLAGVTNRGEPKTQRLLPNPYSLVAQVRSVEAAQSPAGLVPDPAAAWEPAPADDDLPIPTLAPGCEGPPVIDDITSQGTQPWSDRKWVYSVYARNCRGEANRVRLQIFTAPENRTGPPNRVFQRIDASYSFNGRALYPRYSPTGPGSTLNRSCLPQAVFLDMCVRPAAPAPAVCVRSTVGTVEALPVEQIVIGEPRLPPTLTVAPGTPLTLTANLTLPGGCLRDASAGLFRCPQLVGVVRRLDGTIRRGRLVWGPTVTIDTFAGGVTPADDGARVYVEFKRAECAGVEGALVGSTGERPWMPLTQTTVHVAAPGAAAVTRQDTAVPVIHRVEYPRTRWGEPVTIRVWASMTGQPGKRRTANGTIVPTALTYQWYLADKESSYSVDQLTLLAGETGSELPLDKAECINYLSCGRYGCSDLVRYAVEVCSTAGCTLSPVVYPVVAPPADAELAARLLRTNECYQFA